MPTHESKYGIGDRVVVAGKPATVEGILINGSGLAYYVTGRVEQVSAALVEPAPPEPEKWPKVKAGGWLDYADVVTAPFNAAFCERVAKLERLAWLVTKLNPGSDSLRQGPDPWPEWAELVDYFRQFHGPTGEVYLETEHKLGPWVQYADHAAEVARLQVKLDALTQDEILAAAMARALEVIDGH